MRNDHHIDRNTDGMIFSLLTLEILSSDFCTSLKPINQSARRSQNQPDVLRTELCTTIHYEYIGKVWVYAHVGVHSSPGQVSCMDDHVKWISR